MGADQAVELGSTSATLAYMRRSRARACITSSASLSARISGRPACAQGSTQAAPVDLDRGRRRSFGLKATPRLAGMVQGVVVQIDAPAGARRLRAAFGPRRIDLTGNFTQIVGLCVVVVLDLGLGERGLLDRATTSPAWSRGRASRSSRTS